MVPAAHSRGPGREQGSGKPVDEAGSRWHRSRRSKAPTRSWSTAPPQSEDERARLPELLARGAQAHGFRGEVWTCERVAIVIRREFGVSYHPSHVSRVVRALGLCLQKPQRRAEQRNEEAIDNWKEKKWPSLKRGRSRKAEP